MITERYDRHGAASSRLARTLVCTAGAVWFWPGILLTEKRGEMVQALPRNTIANIVARLHGPIVVHRGPGSTVERAAMHLSHNDVAGAKQVLACLHLPSVTPDGHLLMNVVTQALGILMPAVQVGSSSRLWSDANIDLFASLHVRQARYVRELAKLFDPEAHEPDWGSSGQTIAKAGFDPNEPRDVRGQWTTSGDRHSAAPYRDRSPQHGFVSPDGRGAHSGIQFVVDEENDPRQGVQEDFTDPLAETRSFLYSMYSRQIRELDPDNPELSILTSGHDWVPTWNDVAQASYTLDVARATQDAENGLMDAPPTNWERGWAARGYAFGRLRGENLPSNFPVIDRFENGIVTSIKTIDLNAPTYQNPARLEGRINAFVNKLRDFEGKKWALSTIRPTDIKERVLDIVIPKESGTGPQLDAIRRAQIRSWGLGIAVNITPY